jgi:hypothetical protein
MSYDVQIHWSPPEQLYRVFVREQRPNGDVAYMLAPAWKWSERHARVPAEAIWEIFDLDLVKAFAQAAWEQGWRPKGFGTEDVNTMKAHLEDKREEVRWLRDQLVNDKTVRHVVEMVQPAKDAA